ncbi:hypothetical protein RP20_CCG001796 [Aedes albopictus]|nr:hypothetical protein RP20_CCG001796 [Aedes albopictus]
MSDRKTISKEQKKRQWSIKLAKALQKIKAEISELNRLCSSQNSAEHEERRIAYKIKLRRILGAPRRSSSIAMKHPMLRRLCEEIRKNNRRDGIPNEYTRGRECENVEKAPVKNSADDEPQ